MATIITVQATILAPIAKVWKYFTEPEHIKKWNNASDDWHTPAATNDLQVGGKFSYTMAAKDGSMSFNFDGEYNEVDQHQLIAYTMGDGREASLYFHSEGNTTTITETFEAETQNTIDLQRGGWQAILDNFKKYVELN